MNLFLRNIATIRTGYHYRSKVKDLPWGTIRLIQMGDAWLDTINQTTQFARVEIDKLSTHHLLRKGDLIFRPRGGNTTTILIEKDMPRTICAAPLMVIRVNQQQEVLPAYLNWYINLPGTQMEIASFAQGKKVRSISAAAMEGLELPVPELAIQHFIVEQDSKARLALQRMPSAAAALAQSNAILLGYAGDERYQSGSE